MRIIVYLSIVIVSMAAFIAGLMLNNMLLIIPGGMASILVFLDLYLKQRKDREKFGLPEDKYETVLSFKEKKSFKISKGLLTFVLLIVLGMAILIIIYIGMKTYLYTPSSLSLENVINEGCRRFNIDNGLCQGDPDKIIINYDVNKDGIVGGVNDTLSKVLGPDCDLTCVKKRCGCMV